MHTQIFIDTGSRSWDSAGRRHGSRPLDSVFKWSCGMDIEKELLDAFDRVVHEDFPNPQRINCPGRDALRRLAQQPVDTQVGQLLAHIRQCAPCFDELKELRSKMRSQSPQLGAGNVDH